MVSIDSQPSGPDAIQLEDGSELRMIATVGVGTDSTVYMAERTSPSGIRRVVAAKVFHTVATEELEHVTQVMRAAAVRAAAVRHPNVAQVEDFGVRRSQPFILSELVEGVSLQTLLATHRERRARLPLDVALFIGTEVAEGLDGARVAAGPSGLPLGLVHLSLSPTEVLLSFHGEVKLTDFEIATARGASSSVRSMRTFSRRVYAMSPEVACGHPGTQRSDVFSLGVMLRDMFIGPRFSRTPSHAEAVDLAREGFVEPVSFQPHLPEPLLEIIERCIAVDPDERFPHAGGVAYELRRVGLSMGVGDGRYFLRSLLDRQWGGDAAEVTLERRSEVVPAMGHMDVEAEGYAFRRFADDAEADVEAPLPFGSVDFDLDQDL